MDAFYSFPLPDIITDIYLICYMLCFMHIFYYVHKFFIALFNTLCILFAAEFLPSLTFQIQILSCWNFLNPSRYVTSCFMLVAICMLPKWLQILLLHIFKCKLTKQELPYISHYYLACGQALYSVWCWNRHELLTLF